MSGEISWPPAPAPAPAPYMSLSLGQLVAAWMSEPAFVLPSGVECLDRPRARVPRSMRPAERARCTGRPVRSRASHRGS